MPEFLVKQIYEYLQLLVDDFDSLGNVLVVLFQYYLVLEFFEVCHVYFALQKFHVGTVGHQSLPTDACAAFADLVIKV